MSVPQVLVNGVALDLEEEDLEAAIVTHMQRQTFTLQQALFTVCVLSPTCIQNLMYSHMQNKLSDKNNVYDYFMDQPHVLPRVNRHVLARSHVLDMSFASKWAWAG
jgi:hypothetical protein